MIVTRLSRVPGHCQLLSSAFRTRQRQDRSEYETCKAKRGKILRALCLWMSGTVFNNTEAGRFGRSLTFILVRRTRMYTYVASTRCKQAWEVEHKKAAELQKVEARDYRHQIRH
jgi:hypothetical protein